MPDSQGRPSNNDGKVYVTQTARTWPKAPAPWFDSSNTTYLVCPRCENTWMGVIVSEGPFIQLFCPQCGFAWGPMEMHKPQMTNSVAARIGMELATPGEFQSIESEFDLPPGEAPED
jgi:hypothetical protein